MARDPSTSPAIDAAGVREALRRYRRNAWSIAIAGTALFLGFVIAAVVVEDRADDLERTGIEFEGRVVDHREGLRALSGHVDVEFEHEGRRRVERVHLDDESPRYETGQAVTVLVDPKDPSHVSIEGETNQSPWTVWPMIAALIAGTIGMVSGFWSVLREWRQRRLMSRESWRRVGIRYEEVAGPRSSVRPLLMLSENGTEHLLTLMSTRPTRLGRLGFGEAGEVEVVGVLPGYVVVRRPGSELVASARPPFTRRRRRAWSRHFTSGDAEVDAET